MPPGVHTLQNSLPYMEAEAVNMMEYHSRDINQLMLSHSTYYQRGPDLNKGALKKAYAIPTRGSKWEKAYGGAT